MRFFRLIKAAFREGAKFWLPVALMTLLLIWLVNKVIALGAMLVGWFGLLQALIFVVALFASIAIFGWLRLKVKGFALLLGSAQARIEKFPLAGRVFRVLRQTVEALLTREDANQKYLGVVLIRPAGQGAWQLALLTNSFEVGNRTLLACYVPPALNAFVGLTYWMYSDQRECVARTSLSVEEALQAILSYGMVVPRLPEVPEDPPAPAQDTPAKSPEPEKKDVDIDLL